MDISGLTTFFTAILDAAVKIAALVAAVAVAAAGFMYFGVVGHNQRAMEAAQNGVRAAFLGLAFVWGAKELINLVAGAAGSGDAGIGGRMSEQSPLCTPSRPTCESVSHSLLAARSVRSRSSSSSASWQPDWWGRTVCLPLCASRGSHGRAMVGQWALVHIQRRTLDGWLELAFRQAHAAQRVWRQVAPA
jgi:hypothetical protein